MSVDLDKFKQAAAPLADFLASIPVNDPFHQGVLADLTDLVNEIRDNYIRVAEERIKGIQASPDFYFNFSKREEVARYQQIIRHQLGGSNASS